MDSKHSLWASVVAAVGASICCVGPLVLVMLGIGGAWIGQLSKLEPLRPYFVVSTLGLLVWSWRLLYRAPQICAPGKSCVEPKVRRRQRIIFWMVSVMLLLLLALPHYASLFY
jgi:mercuric ion transport protein